MARVLRSEYPMPNYNEFHDWNKYVKACDDALSAIPKDRLYHYPYADGQAYYYVVSFTPLVLQHIPYMDAWKLPEAHLRGLRLKDIDACIKRDVSIKKLFSNSIQ